MTIPTQAQLYEEVDRRFAAEYPNAPTRLDPDDPDQAPYVMEWLRIRDEVLIEWTDYVFAEFFPHAGRLDPVESRAQHVDRVLARHPSSDLRQRRWSVVVGRPAHTRG